MLMVPLAYGMVELPGEGQAKLDAYWRQMKEHVEGFESKLGQIKHIYHEMVSESGEAGLRRLKAVNHRSHDFLSPRCEAGAALEDTEDEELLRQALDLQQCLLLPLTSEAVFHKLREWLDDANRKRYEHIARRIDETLGASEVGVLLISEGHQVQFPQGVEVFYVAPPALDELQRWLRDDLEARRREAQEKAPADSQPGADSEVDVTGG